MDVTTSGRFRSVMFFCFVQRLGLRTLPFLFQVSTEWNPMVLGEAWATGTVLAV